MISVAQAERLIRRALKPAPTITVPLADAVGEVLREPLRADRPMPPFDRVMMDGIALSFARGKAAAGSFASREFKLPASRRCAGAVRSAASK